MKRVFFSSVTALCLLTSCQTSSPLDQIVAQKYVHKYGFDVSEKEWEERSEEGQVITTLRNGVRIAKSYENGKLHGPTSYTFPHSNSVEKVMVYDQGSLLKETLYDPSGMPTKEEVYEFDSRTVVTHWDEKGVPLSIEEYASDSLIEGQYFTSEHLLESKVVDGTGIRSKRDRSGLLLYKDRLDGGALVARTTYHPSGNIHTVSEYRNSVLHGEQRKYSSTGKPLLELHWNYGILDGTKVVFRNGQKIAEIPYVAGQKEGVETHFDDLGYLTAEIEWKADKKHGPSKYYTDDGSEMEWFFKGDLVTAKKFEQLEARAQMIAELSID